MFRRIICMPCVAVNHLHSLCCCEYMRATAQQFIPTCELQLYSVSGNAGKYEVRGQLDLHCTLPGNVPALLRILPSALNMVVASQGALSCASVMLMSACSG